MALYCARSLGDVKAIVGRANVFEWVSPAPLVIDTVLPLVGNPTLTVHLPSGDVVLPMTYNTPREWVSVATDRRTVEMTPGWGVGLIGLARNGEAWLSSRDCSLPCVVQSGTESLNATLAHPLPYVPEFPGAGEGVLQLSRCEVTLPAATVCAALARDVRWTVDYTARHDTSGSLTESRQDTGLLQIVRQPFATGVTSPDVPKFFRGIGASPGAQEGWEPSLQSAEEELILWLREQLVDRGLTEDDVPAPQSLRLAHLHLTAAYILAIADPEQAQAQRDRAVALASMAIRRIWIDSDQDGEVDDGEVEQVGGSRARDFRFAARSSYSRQWTVGGSH
jgi:hypothetical protein